MTDRTVDLKPHALQQQDVLHALDTDVSGLGTEEAKRRLEVHGANLLPAAPKRSPVVRFLSQFHNILIYVLLASAAVTGIMQHWIDTGVILAVVFGNAVVGYLQEGRAEDAMNAIRVMLAPHAAALRDGRRTSIDAADLVPGDIVLVEAGDRVPADLRLLEARSLKVEEAALTGESVPVDKTQEAVSADAVLGDRSSMLFSGTLVATGTGKGVVVATGMATEIGKISSDCGNHFDSWIGLGDGCCIWRCCTRRFAPLCYCAAHSFYYCVWGHVGGYFAAIAPSGFGKRGQGFTDYFFGSQGKTG
jgi:magnesium-transporting ATPase (P-type)